jgi:hypothetical protein
LQKGTLVNIAPRLRSLATTGLLASLLVVGGCIDEKDTLTVYPNGSGKLHLKQTLGKQMSQVMLMFAGKDADSQKEAAKKALYKELSSWEGTCAWTDLAGSVDAGKVSMEATAYFDDVSKLKKLSDNSTETFAWTKNADGTFTLEWNVKNEGTSQKPEKNLLDEETPKQDQVKSFLDLMKDLRMEHEVVMPGAVTDATGCKDKKDRSASGVLSGEDLGPMFKDLVAKIDDYKKKVAAGEMTKENASAELKSKSKSLGLNNVKVTAKAGDTDAEFGEFAKALEAAKKAYPGSETETLVKDAKKSVPGFPGAPKGSDKKGKKGDDDDD